MKTIRYIAPALFLFMTTGSALADAGHTYKNVGTVSDGHWMAPTEAARRGNPVSADSVSRERGRRLFEANCVSCHGPTGRGNGPIAARLETLPPDFTAMAEQRRDGDFAWKIAEGRGSMPAWKGVLKDAEIWDLVNYIQSLVGSDTPRGHTHAH